MNDLGMLNTFAIGAGVAGLIMAWLTYRYVNAQSPGNDTMKELGDMIHAGAMTFLRREYSYLVPFLIVVAGLLALAVGPATAGAYLGGGISSILAGLFGMQSATKANTRTSEAARGGGQSKALRVAFSGGAVMGLSVASLGLLGIGLAFTLVLGTPTAGSDWVGFSQIITGIRSLPGFCSFFFEV